MKLSTSILLTASKKEFLFSDGSKEYRFRPVVYLSPEKKVLSVGEVPMQGDVAQEARIFEDPKSSDDPFALLEAMMRIGIREVAGRMHFGPISVSISIDPELGAFLSGFAPALFYFAAQHAGATKITIK